MHHRYDLSLVLACYNEGEIFTQSVKEIISVLDKTDWSYEIIFVDDASVDNTVQLIKQVIRKYPRKALSALYHTHNQGRGKTVTDGFLQAQGRVVGFIDVDLEIPAWYIPRAVEAIQAGADAAIGWRVYDLNLKGLIRWLASKGYMWLRRQMLGIKLKDTESGFKFFSREKILPVLKTCQDPHWFWDTEIVARAIKAGLNIREIPVVFIRRQDKTSTVRLLPDTLDYLKKLIHYRHQLKLS
jgi:glycosyltransferase AglD